MENKIDNTDLVKEQYKNSSNLDARINLHSFNINKIDWHVWCFEKMNMPEGSKVLELGCGNGLLWTKNKEAIKQSLDITLSDLSEGMLQGAKKNINNPNIKYQIIDVQDIPYEDECFDVVIARHMLYHVPDIDKALSEIKRVLKPNGKFYVSTNGSENMKELKDLVNGYNKDTKYNPQKVFADKFGIENGTEILKRYFNNVKLEKFDGQIVVDKAEPVVGYVTSGMNTKKGKFDGFYDYVKAEIEKVGAIKINTRSGMFIASNL